MLKRTVILLAVNGAVFFVLAEIVGLAVFYYQHGWLFYADPYRPVYAAITQQGQGEGLTDTGLNPYFGPIHRPGIPFDVPSELRDPQAPPVPASTNNFGFVSTHDYPFNPSGQDQFVIGIFGGSVGAWFCEVGVGRLLADLRQNAFFERKTLVPLCFAHEGYKQPQQLLVLAYFLSIGQRFDLVVNIDGFNEVAIGHLNQEHGWDVSMPSVLHLDPLVNLVNQSTLTPAKLESLAALSRDRERLNALAARLNRNHLASVDFVLGRYYAFLDQRYRNELVRFSELPSNPPQRSAIHVPPPVRERTGDAEFADIARDWITASAMMNDLLAARHVPYVHVLQPNQYYSTRKFSDAESKVAFNAGSPFRHGAAEGYPYLEKALQAADAPVKVFNGVHIFDDEAGAVYVDDCCHYTLKGNQRLADFVAKSVLSSRGAWNAP